MYSDRRQIRRRVRTVQVSKKTWAVVIERIIIETEPISHHRKLECAHRFEAQLSDAFRAADRAVRRDNGTP